jgi:hypothetical protein
VLLLSFYLHYVKYIIVCLFVMFLCICGNFCGISSGKNIQQKSSAVFSDSQNSVPEKNCRYVTTSLSLHGIHSDY